MIRKDPIFHFPVSDFLHEPQIMKAEWISRPMMAERVGLAWHHHGNLLISSWPNYPGICLACVIPVGSCVFQSFLGFPILIASRRSYRFSVKPINISWQIERDSLNIYICHEAIFGHPYDISERLWWQDLSSTRIYSNASDPSGHRSILCNFQQWVVN